MTQTNDSPGLQILSLWARLHRKPLGSWIFSRFAGRLVPYTGSIRSRVQVLRPGYAQVLMKDRRAVRNHLGSIHAVALVNLGEFTSGLAFVTSLPSDLRGIVTELKATYIKKARGPLTARSSFDPSDLAPDTEQMTQAEITDSDDVVVARIAARWNVRRARD